MQKLSSENEPFKFNYSKRYTVIMTTMFASYSNHCTDWFTFKFITTVDPEIKIKLKKNMYLR